MRFAGTLGVFSRTVLRQVQLEIQAVAFLFRFEQRFSQVYIDLVPVIPRIQVDDFLTNFTASTAATQ